MLSPIGVVKKVFFNKIVIEIDDMKKLNQNYKGDIYSCEGLDTFILLEKSYEEKLIYQISALYDEERPLEKEDNSKFQVKAYFEAAPIGNIIKEKFEYGIERYPLLGDEVYLASKEELNKILENDLEINENNFIIGELSNKKGYYPKINIDNFFTTHISILGNTGSGKSTTIKTIIKKLSEKIDEHFKKENINFYIFDIHNEYTNIKAELSNKTSLDEISIPLELLKKEDWLNLVLPSSAVQLPILINTLKLGNLLENSQAGLTDWIKVYCAKKLYESQQTDAVTKRTKIISFLSEIDDENIKKSLSSYNSQFGNFSKEEEKYFLDSLDNYIGVSNAEKFLYENLRDAEISIKDIMNLKIALDTILSIEEAKGGNQIRNYCSPLVTRIDNLINQYSKTLFSNDEKKLKKFNLLLEHKDKAFEIINCSGYDNHDLLFITGFILNNIYEREKNNRKSGIKNLIHFIFDEAHTYISENTDVTSFNPIAVFEKIAKEGRKFGLFMILSSQRPSELSKTVLSQCNNFILHRIRNNIDLEQMRKSIPYILDAQLLRLSYLKTGHALVVGEGFNIQLELKIHNDIEDKSSETFKPSEVWKN
ncbi:ATP-binding protein [Fusobacterium massiliense]|uniref:ATP-binding protein n=1 Tax=Fusobacterium massiliense TaxID=1852365 RepID=UPI0028E6FA75|nr:ATP-binding protein [Fusobacterium massiliense]